MIIIDPKGDLLKDYENENSISIILINSKRLFYLWKLG